MNIKITNIEAVSAVEWYNQTQEKLKELPLKVQWTIRKNIKALQPTHEEFNNFRAELDQKKNEEWFVEGNGKCEKVENEDGDEVLKILDDYIEEFVEYNNNLNQQLNEILVEETEYEVTPIDIEGIVDYIDEKEIEFDMNDIEVLTLFEEK